MGTIYATVKILDIEKKIRLFVIDNRNFKHDILLGLDSIIAFRLCQDYNCKITQATVMLARAHPLVLKLTVLQI